MTTFPQLMAGLGVAALGALGGTTFAQQPFDIALRDGLLSVRANNAPIQALADALSGETGVSFIVTGDTEQSITTEIVDEPLANAVSLLSPNHLLVRGAGGHDAPIIEVVLMLDDASSGAGGDSTQFLPSGAPADEIPNDEIPTDGALPASNPPPDPNGEPVPNPAALDPSVANPDGQ